MTFLKKGLHLWKVYLFFWMWKVKLKTVETLQQKSKISSSWSPGILVKCFFFLNKTHRKVQGSSKAATCCCPTLLGPSERSHPRTFPRIYRLSSKVRWVPLDRVPLESMYPCWDMAWVGPLVVSCHHVF